MAPPPPQRRRAPRPKPVEEVRKRLEPQGPKKWGKVARQGAGTMKGEDEATASGAWRQAMKQARDRDTGPPERDTTEWQREEPKARKPKPARTRKTADLNLSPAVTDQINASAQRGRGARINQRLREAADAFEHERFQDSARLLKSLVEIAPSVPAVHELYGLSLYRLGRYRDAAKALQTYVDMTGDVDQHPVLADCYRALKRWKRVDQLWDELREASPGAELVAEGRIVVAGSMADRGDMPGAIAVLEAAKAEPKRPKEHHLRLWYALADLYERAGDVPRARRLFGRIAAADPEFFDARDRRRG